MKKMWLFMASIFAAALLLVSACGGSDNAETTTGSTGSATISSTAFVCDKTGPSLIPKPSGKPQLIYFYRDT
ncbi:MAG: hypothetical protein WC935_06230 [Thermoleophilia bacterium]